MVLLYTLILFLSVKLSVSSANVAHFLSDNYIEEINSEQDLWRAGRNFDANTPLSEIKILMGTFMHGREKINMPVKTFDPEWPEDKKIPKKFDARKKWHKKCPRIGEILDQGKCGSDWAITAAQAFTDRYCIATKGKHQMRLSTANVLSCSIDSYGCNGGWESYAWRHFTDHGLPSGGNYNSWEGCQPYLIQSPCHRKDGDPYETCPLNPVTPSCYNSCYNKEYTKELDKDYRYARDVTQLPSDEKAIMKEIMTRGPVTGSFLAREDFVNYKSGVYEPKNRARILGGHAVKIIGWGVEKKTPYWLIQNSWNEYWGDHGLAKMKRNCPPIGLEREVYAARADLKRSNEGVVEVKEE